MRCLNSSPCGRRQEDSERLGSHLSNKRGAQGTTQNEPVLRSRLRGSRETRFQSRRRSGVRVRADRTRGSHRIRSEDITVARALPSKEDRASPVAQLPPPPDLGSRAPGCPREPGEATCALTAAGALPSRGHSLTCHTTQSPGDGHCHPEGTLRPAGHGPSVRQRTRCRAGDRASSGTPPLGLVSPKVGSWACDSEPLTRSPSHLSLDLCCVLLPGPGQD